MAKIVILGEAIVVTSELKLEDIRTIKKYRPDALILKGGEEGKDPIFAIAEGNNGDINKFGICFTGETRDDDKKATLTTSIDYDGEDIEEYVSDKFGAVITNLNKLEATLPSVIKEITDAKAAVKKNITVIQ